MSHPEYEDIGHPATRVIEECSEVIKEVCKAQRFGWFNHHPDKPGKTNISRIMKEMDDAVNAFEKLEVWFRQMLEEKAKTALYKPSLERGPDPPTSES